MDHSNSMSCILPSNAQLLPSNRILQQRCGNESSASPGSSVDQEVNYQLKPDVSSSGLDSNGSFVSEIYRSNFPASRQRNELELERETEILTKRFLRCTAYKKYREKQPKDGGLGKEQKWPVNMEMAFFKGQTFQCDRRP
jgi:hypothetical protein